MNDFSWLLFLEIKGIQTFTTGALKKVLCSTEIVKMLNMIGIIVKTPSSMLIDY